MRKYIDKMICIMATYIIFHGDKEGRNTEVLQGIKSYSSLSTKTLRSTTQRNTNPAERMVEQLSYHSLGLSEFAANIQDGEAHAIKAISAVLHLHAGTCEADYMLCEAWALAFTQVPGVDVKCDVPPLCGRQASDSIIFTSKTNMLVAGYGLLMPPEYV